MLFDKLFNTSNPILCLVLEYSGSGFPKPTIKYINFTLSFLIFIQYLFYYIFSEISRDCKRDGAFLQFYYYITDLICERKLEKLQKPRPFCNFPIFSHIFHIVFIQIIYYNIIILKNDYNYVKRSGKYYGE